MTIWRLEWRSALARRRLFLWNMAVPVLLLAPVALSAAAAPHRTAVFGVFFVFFATFGSAIPTVRDAHAGWLDTIFQSGYSRARWLVETVLAGATLDFVQLFPVVLVLVAASGRAGARAIPSLIFALLLALGFANLLGHLLAAAVRSLAEAALACAATSLLLLHFAGFFRTPTTPWAKRAAEWAPYRPLREGLAALQGASPSGPPDSLPAVLAASLGAVVLIVFVRRWTVKFEWPWVD